MNPTFDLTEKRKPGRPRHLPTAEQRKQVSILKGMGWNNTAICRFLGITDKTLLANYKEELDTGKDVLGCRLTLGLAQQALQGKLPAIFFTLKTQFGWRENVGLQPLGRDGEPVSFDRIDTPTLERILAALTASGAGKLDSEDLGATSGGWADGGMDPQSGTPD